MQITFESFSSISVVIIRAIHDRTIEAFYLTIWTSANNIIENVLLSRKCFEITASKVETSLSVYCVGYRKQKLYALIFFYCYRAYLTLLTTLAEKNLGECICKN